MHSCNPRGAHLRSQSRQDNTSPRLQDICRSSGAFNIALKLPSQGQVECCCSIVPEIFGIGHIGPNICSVHHRDWGWGVGGIAEADTLQLIPRAQPRVLLGGQLVLDTGYVVAGNEQLLMALLVLGGPPLLAPLLFRRGDGRVLVPVCGALAAGLGFVVRAEVLDGQVGHVGAELVVLAYAVPYASVVAVVALVCSLTRGASGYFRYGPEACGPDCYGPQCYAGHLAPSTDPGRRPRA